MHDGSTILLKKVDPDYDPTRRNNALGYLERHRRHGEIVTGVLFIDQNVPDMHEQSRSTEAPLRDLPFEELCPDSEELQKLQTMVREIEDCLVPLMTGLVKITAWMQKKARIELELRG